MLRLKKPQRVQVDISYGSHLTVQALWVHENSDPQQTMPLTNLFAAFFAVNIREASPRPQAQPSVSPSLMSCIPELMSTLLAVVLSTSQERAANKHKTQRTITTTVAKAFISTAICQVNHRAHDQCQSTSKALTRDREAGFDQYSSSFVKCQVSPRPSSLPLLSHVPSTRVRTFRTSIRRDDCISNLRASPVHFRRRH